jgi:hypothetical protein
VERLSFLIQINTAMATTATTTTTDIEDLKEWRKHPGLGPSQVRNQLRRGGFKVSTRTVHMLMSEHGYVAPKVKEVETHDYRYEAVRPNQLYLVRSVREPLLIELPARTAWLWYG